jgi:hypothetical protein
MQFTITHGGDMTRDDIIRMAREAGLCRDDEVWYSRSDVDADVTTDDLERFAALVAAAERELTVMECIRYFNEDYQRDFHIKWREDLTDGIKDHFGV